MMTAEIMAIAPDKMTGIRSQMRPVQPPAIVRAPIVPMVPTPKMVATIPANADDKAEVDEDGSDDDTRKSALDAIVINADTGDLRINDDEEEDDEDDVGNISEVGPDDVDWRALFH